MKKKYSQFQNKFFIKVPVAQPGSNLSYLDCYVYGYIDKKLIDTRTLSLNLQIKKNKLNLIINKLKKYNLINELNNKFYTIKENESKLFLSYEKDIIFDTTFLPNLEYLSFEQNAIYWKLYKYSDPVCGLDNCYTISSKISIEKMNYWHLTKILGFSNNKIKQSIRILKKLNLIKIKRSTDGFYFGIQPIKREMNNFWRDNDSLFYSNFLNQKEVLDSYSQGLLNKK